MRNRTPNIEIPVADLSLAEFYGDASFVHQDVVDQIADSIGRVIDERCRKERDCSGMAHEHH